MKKTHKYFYLSITDIFDIGLMKLSEISGRGSKKDFVDLYFLLHYFSLSKLFAGYKDKYGIGISNFYHLQKSLVYFENAELQPMPKMVKNVEWQKIKNSIVLKVKKLNF